MSQLVVNGDRSHPTLVLAHGAGAGSDSDFMQKVAVGVSEQGICVVRFDFPYMQQQKETGKRRPPDRQPKLIAHFKEVLTELNRDNVVIGGKSMGGRMATILATEMDVPGVVVLGYPFHALGKPEKVRTDHFCQLSAPVLICQGERDSMGTKAEVAQYRLPKSVELEWFADGDHDLKPRKSSGFTHESHIQSAINRVAQFVHEITAS